MDGVLVVDKPLGPTSHDVVARVRRLFKVRRVGHTGTLDPLATGVLPLVIGRATRLAQFFASDRKDYVASVRFGDVTPTYDAEGRIVNDPKTGRPVALPPTEPRNFAIDEAMVRNALGAFRGTYWQTPPPFSAKKVGGTPAYQLARSSRMVDVKPIQVSVDELMLVRFDGSLAELNVTCSTGFYVRSLAHDLGQKLGCGAYLESLRRTRAGEFGIEQAVPLEELERDVDAAARRLIAMEDLLPSFPRVVLNERGAERVSHGNTIPQTDVTDNRPDQTSPVVADAAETTAGGRVRLVDTAGRLLGIAERGAGNLLRPLIVLV
jgi:tRNA pseudouridine55 synthase